MACSSLLSDDDLRRFRTKPCRRNYQQGGRCEFGPDRCQYSHSDSWPRRCPFYLSHASSIRYIPRVCPNVTLAEGNDPTFKNIGTVISNTCTRGGACPFAHSLEEFLYHPLYYKTKFCPNFLHGECNTYYCPFIHGSAEERNVSAIKYTLPFSGGIFKSSPYPNVELTTTVSSSVNSRITPRTVDHNQTDSSPSPASNHRHSMHISPKCAPFQESADFSTSLPLLPSCYGSSFTDTPWKTPSIDRRTYFKDCQKKLTDNTLAPQEGFTFSDSFGGFKNLNESMKGLFETFTTDEQSEEITNERNIEYLNGKLRDDNRQLSKLKNRSESQGYSSSIKTVQHSVKSLVRQETTHSNLQAGFSQNEDAASMEARRLELEQEIKKQLRQLLQSIEHMNAIDKHSKYSEVLPSLLRKNELMHIDWSSGINLI